VGLLTSPSVLAGSSHPVIGSVVSLREIVATFGRVLGREIRYEEISDDEWRAAALARGFNQHAVEHLSALWRTFRSFRDRPKTAAFEVTDTIEVLGGAKPKSLEVFLREELRALTAE
jgi:uncharacterized protein YbjT (DUF2867 family)